MTGNCGPQLASEHSAGMFAVFTSFSISLSAWVAIDKFSKDLYACRRKDRDEDCAMHDIILQKQMDLANRAGGEDPGSSNMSQYG